MVKSDTSKLWLLLAIVSLSGLPIGVPVINMIAFFMAQVALIILVVRYSYLFAIIPCLIAMAVSSLFYGFSASMMYFFLALLPGLLMGFKSRTFNTPRSIVFWGFAPYLVLVLITILFYADISSQSELIAAEFKGMIQEDVMPMGLSGAELEQFMEMANQVIYWTTRLLPGILFTMFAALVLFVYLAATSTAKYFGAVIPSMAPSYFWKIGELWLIPFGISMAFVLIGNEGIRILGENLLVFFIHFYAFFGICVIDFYLNQLNIPFVVRFIIYLLLLLPVITIPLLALLGIIDSRFDFRKLAFENEN